MRCEVRVGRRQLDHISIFKYLGCVEDELGTDEQNAVGSGECEEGCRWVVIKGLKRVFSSGSTMWREWIITRLLRESI